MAASTLTAVVSVELTQDSKRLLQLGKTVMRVVADSAEQIPADARARLCLAVARAFEPLAETIDAEPGPDTGLPAWRPGDLATAPAFTYWANDRKYQSNHRMITGAQIRRAARLDPSHDLWMVKAAQPDAVLWDHAVVDLEYYTMFYTRPKVPR